MPCHQSTCALFALYVPYRLGSVTSTRLPICLPLGCLAQARILQRRTNEGNAVKNLNFSLMMTCHHAYLCHGIVRAPNTMCPITLTAQLYQSETDLFDSEKRPGALTGVLWPDTICRNKCARAAQWTTKCTFTVPPPAESASRPNVAKCTCTAGPEPVL